MPDPTSVDTAEGHAGHKCYFTGQSEPCPNDAALVTLRAELDALRARLVQTEATLTDFANPDHWVQNDDGEWVWYGTYPPFERPALDLLGSLGSSSPEAPPVAAGTTDAVST